jgi:hypothetical protein
MPCPERTRVMTVYRQYGWTRLAEGFAARWFSIPYLAGLKIMMDFGFGAFLNKFEEYYGKRATKVLVGVLGLTAVGLAMSMLASNVVTPVYNWIAGSPDAFSDAWSFVLSLATAVYVAVVMASAMNAINIKRKIYELNELNEDVNNNLSEARSIHNQVVRDRRGTRTILEKLQLAIYSLRNVSNELANGEPDADVRRSLEELSAMITDVELVFDEYAKASAEAQLPKSHPDTATETQPRTHPG